MKVLFWNVRGLSSSCRRLRQLIRHEKVNLVSISEPFLTADRIEDFARKLNLQFSFASQSCKIWLFWSDVFSINVLHDSDQYVCCEVKFTPWDFSFCFVAVYAKHTRVERQTLWAELSELLVEGTPVLIGGDFNAISSISEYLGSSIPDLNSIADFSNFISDCNLYDLPTVDGFYSWSGIRRTGRVWKNSWSGIRRTGRVWKRLDRFLMSTSFRDFFTDARAGMSSFRDFFTDARAGMFSRTSSDHAPILFSGHKEDFSGPRQFRFQNMWITHHGFDDLVSSSWNAPAFGGGMRAFAFKLKRLKLALREWNRNVFGNVFDKVRSAEVATAEAESRFDIDATPENREHMARQQANLLLALRQEEIFWKQKARVKWLSEGDANTRFFHNSVRDRHRRQRISFIRGSNGDFIFEQELIKSEAVSFFSKLYSEEPCSDVDAFIANIQPSVSDLENATLTAAITNQEVKEAVWALDPDSAAGPDGYSGSFFRHCWHIIEDDLYMAVLDFFAGVPVPQSIGSAQIMLIPKKSNPDFFADFRPICLCTFISKVFTRIIMTRIKNLLPKLISREQTAFVSGRSIQDNVLLAHELIHYINKKCRGSNVAVKLDMMKAFDRVAWPFLRAILLKFGFDLQFVNLILNNLASTRLSILVNGVSCGYFPPTRGVKQGDPLSPILFIIVSEALSSALIREVGSGLISPYYTCPSLPTISHLAFADDLLIFTNGGKTSLKRLSTVLSRYQLASGQRINYQKSFFVTAKRCPANRLRTMERTLSMKSSTLPFRYLGVNLFKGRNLAIYYQIILEKIDHSLQGWQRKFLSPGGRLTLIKHVLMSIPVYSSAVVQLPRKIVLEIERRLARFFWGTNDNRNKYHWTSWSKVCYPVDEGGLGIRSVTAIQQAFASRLWFKFRSSDSIWSSFMRHRYPGPIFDARPSDSHIWKRMIKIADEAEDCMMDSSNGLIWTPSSNGEHSIASAYNFFRPKASRTLSTQCFWNRNIPLKISIFMWRLFRRALPFPEALLRFGLNLVTVCPFCWNSNISMEHCFLSCEVAKAVWHHFGSIFGIALSQVTSFRSICHTWWIHSNGGSAVHIFNGILPSFILWELWTAYNSAIFDGVKVTSLIATFAPKKRSIISWIKWLRPPTGRLKLNTDAAFSSLRSAGGACLRDSSGTLIAALAFPIAASSALEAETFALDFSLRWCDLTAKRPQYIEVDSKFLASLISSPASQIPWRIRDAIARIKEYLAFNNSTISHVYREANSTADALASFGLSCTEPTVFFSFDLVPESVLSSYLHDLRGFSAPRRLYQ
ncbi:uncharacterized protein LOC116033418 [Ipomoea triloba]|uniref:uncharacterized protein LOC116033418 n=1 Tax=Ipomoea triloba TaxID=35885 RepID=UPI00125D0CFF|nr:uncharacterized protein LOC116033418 [Ipomoea triloba]